MPRAPRLLLTRPPSKTATPHVPIESAWRRHCRWEASCCGLRKALLLIRPPSPVPPCSGGGCASIARTSTGCPPTAAVTVLRRAQEPRTVDESQRNDHQQPRRRRARCMVHRRRQATTYWSDVQKGRRHLAMPPMPVDRVDHPPAKACQPPRARPAIFPSSPLHLPLPASDLCREDSAPYPCLAVVCLHTEISCCAQRCPRRTAGDTSRRTRGNLPAAPPGGGRRPGASHQPHPSRIQ